MLNKTRLVGVFATFSLLMTANAHAVGVGPYLGLQFGWANIHQSGISRADLVATVNGIVSPDSFFIQSFRKSSTADGWAGRVFTGYQFNCHWATEIGYTKFHSFESAASILTRDSVSGLLVSIAQTRSGETQAYDLVGKYVMHYNTGFSYYSKLGVAYLWNQIKDANVTNIFGFTTPFSERKSHHKVYPTFGLGVAYDISPCLLGDLSWNRIQRIGGDSNFGETDFFSLGVAYFFNV